MSPSTLWFLLLMMDRLEGLKAKLGTILSKRPSLMGPEIVDDSET
jgi:hypothetical protein